MPDPFAVSPSSRSLVSINTELLSYDAAPGGRSRRRRLLSAILPFTAVSLIAALFVVPSRPVSAALVPVPIQGEAPTEVSLQSARFDLPTEDAGARYSSAIVTAGGAEYRLMPMAGSVRVTMVDADTAAVVADIGGTLVHASVDGFADAVADALASPDVSRSVRLGSMPDGRPAITVFFDRPLGPGDHLLIQEAGGDGNLTVAPVDGNGEQVGAEVTIGSDGIAHHVDIGQQTADGAAAWSTVVPLARLAPEGGTAAGIRLSGSEVQAKVVPLVAGPDPAPSQAAQIGDPAAPVYASVGLEAMVQPAIDVDGAGCVAAPAAPVSVGQAVTFCYTVTNLGSTHLTDIRFDDPQLGLTSAELPVAAGPEILAPGQQVVVFYHTVAATRSSQIDTIVTARPVDADGNPISNLVAPSGVDTPGSIGVEDVPVTDDAPDALAATAEGESAGDVVEVPAVRAVDLTPTDPIEASGELPTELAFTGIPTEPWILAFLAFGLMFIGHTARAAFATTAPGTGLVARRSSVDQGQDQVDSRP